MEVGNDNVSEQPLQHVQEHEQQDERRTSRRTTTQQKQVPQDGGDHERPQEQQQQQQEEDKEDGDLLSLEDVLYGMNSFYAIVQPVVITMVLSALSVIYISTPESSAAQTAELSNTYTVMDTSSAAASEKNNQQLLGASLVNGLIIVSVICVMTFGIVLLYKYRCMKLLLGYMIFASVMLLGFLSAAMFQVAVDRYHWTVDYLSFVFALYNFAVVGTMAIFWGQGIPVFVTQGYLIATSVIVAWQLSHFDAWTAWVLLILLALYDLFAVLTPCGPLKALVNLMQRDNAPEMPGLLYEANIGGGGAANRRRNSRHQNNNRPTPPPQTAANSDPSSRRNHSASTPLRRRDNSVTTNEQHGNDAISAATRSFAFQDTQTNGRLRNGNDENDVDAQGEQDEYSAQQQQPSSLVLFKNDLDKNRQPLQSSESPTESVSAASSVVPLPTEDVRHNDQDHSHHGALSSRRRGPVSVDDSYVQGEENDGGGGIELQVMMNVSSPMSVSSPSNNNNNHLSTQTRPPTRHIPLALAKMYKLPLVDNPNPSWCRRRLVQQQPNTASPDTPATYDATATPTTAQEQEELFTPEQLASLVEAVFPLRGGRIEPHAIQWPQTETRYSVLNHAGEVHRILFVNAQTGRVFQDLTHEQDPAERQRNNKKQKQQHRQTIKLGLGDFIFYSILVAKAALYSFPSFAACSLTIVCGLGMTLLLLAIRGQALPALPVSIFAGVLYYLLTRYIIEPWIQAIFIINFYC